MGFDPALMGVVSAVLVLVTVCSIVRWWLRRSLFSYIILEFDVWPREAFGISRAMLDGHMKNLIWLHLRYILLVLAVFVGVSAVLGGMSLLIFGAGMGGASLLWMVV